MNKPLLRFVALLLVPCLLADPLMASALTPGPSRTSVAKISSFETQALTLTLAGSAFVGEGALLIRHPSFIYTYALCIPFLAAVAAGTSQVERLSGPGTVNPSSSRRGFLKTLLGMSALGAVAGVVGGGSMIWVQRERLRKTQEQRIHAAGQNLLNRFEREQAFPASGEWTADRRREYITALRLFMTEPRLQAVPDLSEFLGQSPNDPLTIEFDPAEVAALDDPALEIALAHILFHQTASAQNLSDTADELLVLSGQSFSRAEERERFKHGVGLKTELERQSWTFVMRLAAYQAAPRETLDLYLSRLSRSVSNPRLRTLYKQLHALRLMDPTLISPFTRSALILDIGVVLTRDQRDRLLSVYGRELGRPTDFLFRNWIASWIAQPRYTTVSAADLDPRPRGIPASVKIAVLPHILPHTAPGPREAHLQNLDHEQREFERTSPFPINASLSANQRYYMRVVFPMAIQMATDNPDLCKIRFDDTRHFIWISVTNNHSPKSDDLYGYISDVFEKAREVDLKSAEEHIDGQCDFLLSLPENAYQAALPAQPMDMKKIVHELRQGPLQKIGSGYEKDVFASEHWVVKRIHSIREMLSQEWVKDGAGWILSANVMNRIKTLRHGPSRSRLRQLKSAVLKTLHLAMSLFLLIVPSSLLAAHKTASRWHIYRARFAKGETLALSKLAGSTLVPARVEIPKTTVWLKEWPFRLTVKEVYQKVDCSLIDKLQTVPTSEIDLWIQRLRDFHFELWKRGVFLGDPTLPNLGVIGDRIVLLDNGLLTDDPREIYRDLATTVPEDLALTRLALQSIFPDPHSTTPEDIVSALQSLMSVGLIRQHWPDPDDPRRVETIPSVTSKVPLRILVAESANARKEIISRLHVLTDAYPVQLHILEVDTPRAAWSQYQAAESEGQPIHLVVTPYVRGNDLSGIELAKRIQDKTDTPVLIVTSSDPDRIAHEAASQQVHVAGVFSKNAEDGLTQPDAFKNRVLETLLPVMDPVSAASFVTPAVLRMNRAADAVLVPAPADLGRLSVDEFIALLDQGSFVGTVTPSDQITSLAEHTGSLQGLTLLDVGAGYGGPAVYAALGINPQLGKPARVVALDRHPTGIRVAQEVASYAWHPRIRQALQHHDGYQILNTIVSLKELGVRGEDIPENLSFYLGQSGNLSFLRNETIDRAISSGAFFADSSIQPLVLEATLRELVRVTRDEGSLQISDFMDTLHIGLNQALIHSLRARGLTPHITLYDKPFGHVGVLTLTRHASAASVDTASPIPPEFLNVHKVYYPASGTPDVIRVSVKENALDLVQTLFPNAQEVVAMDPVRPSLFVPFFEALFPALHKPTVHRVQQSLESFALNRNGSQHGPIAILVRRPGMNGVFSRNGAVYEAAAPQMHPGDILIVNDAWLPESPGRLGLKQIAESPALPSARLPLRTLPGYVPRESWVAFKKTASSPAAPVMHIEKLNFLFPVDEQIYLAIDHLYGLIHPDLTALKRRQMTAGLWEIDPDVHQVWIAKDPTGIVRGFRWAALDLEQPVVQFIAMAIDELFQGQRIGKRLMETAMEALTQSGRIQSMTSHDSSDWIDPSDFSKGRRAGRLLTAGLRPEFRFRPVEGKPDDYRWDRPGSAPAPGKTIKTKILRGWSWIGHPQQRFRGISSPTRRAA